MYKYFSSALLAAIASAQAFDYAFNGDDWGSIPGFELCGTGVEQSPIDIITSQVVQGPLDTLSFRGFIPSKVKAGPIDSSLKISLTEAL